MAMQFPEYVRSGEWRKGANGSMPMLPALAHEAIAVAADADVTIAQLAHVVSKDPTLATRVIHLANAAYCAPLQTINTLPDAIVRMGTPAAARSTTPSAPPTWRTSWRSAWAGTATRPSSPACCTTSASCSS